MDFLLSAIPGLAIAAGVAVLYLVGRASLPKLAAAGSWLKSKFAGASAKLDQFDDEIGQLFSRIAALEGQVARLTPAPIAAVGDALKTVAQAVAADAAPLFLQPKDPAPAAGAVAPAAQPQAAPAVAAQ